MKKIIAIIITLALVVGMTAIFASAEESLVSQGKEYAYTGALVDASGKHYYPDSDAMKFTDGVKATMDDLGYGSEVWIGMNTNATDCGNYEGKATNSITVDLGEVTECTKYVVYAEACDGGIAAPVKVLVEVSADGAEWKTVGEAAGEFESAGKEDQPTWGLYTYTVSGKINAQFVKFTVVHGANWAFVSEVEVYAGGDAEPVPEDPSEEPADNTSSEEPVANTSEETPAESSAAEAEESKAEESKVEESKPASSEEGANLTWLWIVIAVVVVAGVVVAVVLGKKKK